MPHPPFRVETERLVVREWQEADREAFCALAADPEVMRFIADGQPWGEDRVEAFLERQRRNASELGYCLGALVERRSGKLVGQAGLQPLGSTGEVEVGWWLARDHWGQGLATEAARGLLRFAFETAGLQRVVAIARPENAASTAVMEKAGLRFEKTQRHRPLGLPELELEVVLYARERRDNGPG